MKKGWQTKSLRDVCDFDKVQGVHRGLPYVGLEHIEPNTGRFIGSHDPQPVKSSTFRFSTEHVLYGRLRPYLNKAIAPDFEGHCSTEIFPIKPSPAISRAYLLYWLLSDDTMDRINGTCTGARMPRADMNEVLDLPIPVPPLSEQQRIVGLLDEAFASLATAQAHAAQNLQNARDLFESHLNAVFTQRGEGWVEKTLGDVCEFLNGFAFKSGDAVPVSQTQLLRMGNLYCNRLDLERSPVFYPDDFAAEYSRYVLAEGEIIMSLTGTSGKEDYGFAVRIPDCGHILLMNQRLMKFDAIRQDIIDDGYLLHYLRSRCFLNVLYPTANGTRQANLSSATMKLLPVPLPSMNEQKCIAGKLDALSADTQCLTQIYEQKLGALAALKKSLLHQAFSGEL
jgi:type I restriction enzyme, S subunit